MSTSAWTPLSLHEVLSPEALGRAQAFVALLADPPRPKKDEQPHPLRQIVDIISAAEQRRRTAAEATGPSVQGGADGNTHDHDHDDDASASMQEGSTLRPSDALTDLQEALGASAGSAMYRQRVAAPKAHIQGVVRALSAAVARAVCACSRIPEHNLDIHVQLNPKGPFAATVVVRCRDTLSLIAEAHAELERRMLSVAAADQTLRSSLDFWESVSYSDTAAASASSASLRQYDVLGGAVSSLRRKRAADGENDEDEEEDVTEVVLGSWGSVSTQHQRRLPRTTHANAALLSAARQRVETGLCSSGAPLWCQPDPLLIPRSTNNSHTATVSGRGGRIQQRKRERQHQQQQQSRWRQSSDALLVTYYISAQCVAYPVLPHAAESNTKNNGGEAEELGPQVPATSTPEPVAAADPKGKEVNQRWWLPLDTADSFTRGLLGL